MTLVNHNSIQLPAQMQYYRISFNSTLTAKSADTMTIDVRLLQFPPSTSSSHDRSTMARID